MFPARFYPGRYFAPRYWPRAGVEPPEAVVAPTVFASTARRIGPDPARSRARRVGPDPNRSTAEPT